MIAKLLCRIFGHKPPDDCVTALIYLLEFRRAHQCPRCGNRVDQQFFSAALKPTKDK